MILVLGAILGLSLGTTLLLLLSSNSQVTSPGTVPDYVEELRKRLFSRADGEPRAHRRCRRSYGEFVADPASTVNCTIEVYNSDAANGTIDIKHSGYFLLKGDLVFSPNEEHDSLPTAEQIAAGQYLPTDGYKHGFFATIVVRAENVTINLNGFTVSVSDLFRVRQGFHAALAVSIPFIRKEGPGDFGNLTSRAKGIVVENGVLGKTSHHGIHGHLATDVLLRNLKIRDYEVACMSMNGWNTSYAYDVHCEGSATDVPVRGIFTQARVALFFLDRCAQRHAPCADSAARLRSLIVQAEEGIIANNTINAEKYPEAHLLFSSPDGRPRVIDGGAAYGALVTDAGAAVHAVGTPFVRGEGSEYIVFEDCSIRNTRASAVEVVGASFPNGDFITGSVGDLLDFNRYFNEPRIGLPGRDAYIESQMALARAYWTEYTPEERASRELGLVNIPLELVEWYEAGGSAEDLATLYQTAEWRYQRDSDRQGHLPKGSFDGRFDSSANITLINLHIEGGLSSGDAGLFIVMPGENVTDVLNPSTYTAAVGGHPLKGDHVGYNGADAHGLLVAGCEDVTYDSVHFEAPVSVNGKVTAKAI